jgi:hypothetical protein
MKRGGEPGFSSIRPDDPGNAVAMLKGDDEELERLDEDHTRRTRSDA